jgi:hypothetical protein
VRHVSFDRSVPAWLDASTTRTSRCRAGPPSARTGTAASRLSGARREEGARRGEVACPNRSISTPSPRTAPVAARTEDTALVGTGFVAGSGRRVCARVSRC